jgi:hypothetical protein
MTLGAPRVPAWRGAIVAAAFGVILLLLVATPRSYAQAIVVTETHREPLTFVVDDPCSGEPVLVTATQHTHLTDVQDAAGNSHSVNPANSSQAVGVGLVSGAEYRVVFGSVGATHFFRDENGELVGEVGGGGVSRFQLIRLGSDGDFHHLGVFHVVVRDGEVKSEVVHTTTECRG